MYGGQVHAKSTTSAIMSPSRNMTRADACAEMAGIASNAMATALVRHTKSGKR